MIYVAFNNRGKIVGIVNAKSKELAMAFWQGRDTNVHAVKDLDDYISLDEHPTGVIALLETREINKHEIRDGASVLAVK